VLSDAGLTAAKRGAAEEAQIHAFSPAAAIEEALYGALFTAGPAKYPTFGTPASIAGVSAEAVRAFAERAFRPSNAIVVATGDIDEATLASAIPGRAGAPPGAEHPSLERIAAAPAPVQRTGTEAGFGMMWAGPPIANEREATALDFVADYLFAPDTGIAQRSVGPSGAELVGTFVTFHDPGVFLVTATGGDPAAARAAVTTALAAMRTPLAPAAFAQARRAFIYHILSDGETAAELADSYGWYTVEGNAAYTPGEGGARGRYIAAAEALTPAFVAATVAKYLGRAGATVSVTQGKAPG
jgi:predicted Zn-dependent peptidase